MKYYAIKMGENQYDVLEVDGSDKIGVYQVDEMIVREMYALAQQDKLNLVIQESSGVTSYVNLNLARVAIRLEYNIKKLLSGINFLMIAGGFYEKILVIPLYVLLVVLNVGYYYYYNKKLIKRMDGRFIFESPKYEMQGSAINQEKVFRNRQCIFIVLTTLVFGVFIVNHFLVKILPFNDMTLVVLILIDVLIVSISGKNLQKEKAANYRGMQPLVDGNNQIQWIHNQEIANYEITRYRKFNY